MSTTALRTPPQGIMVLETTELLGIGTKEDPYREIKRYWIKNLEGRYIEWFLSDIFGEPKLHIQTYSEILNQPF